MSSLIANSVASPLTSTYFNTQWAAALHPYYDRYPLKQYGSDRLIDFVDTVAGTYWATPAMSVRHVEYGRLQEPIVANAAASGAADATVNLTLTSASLVNSQTPVAVGWMVQLNDNDVAYVDAVNVGANPAVITLRPFVAGQAISIAAGQSMTYAPAALVAEGSTAGLSALRQPPVEFINTLQTLRLDLAFTDEQAASWKANEMAFYNFPLPDGGNTQLWSVMAIMDRETQFHNARELFLLTGKNTTNTTLAAAGLRGTVGLIPAIKTYGNVQNYTGALGYTISDWRDLDMTITKNKGGNEYQLWNGKAFQQSAFDSAKAYLPNEALSMSLFGGSKEAAVQMGFTSINVFGRTFHNHELSIFTDPAWLGNGSYSYDGNFIALPASQQNGQNVSAPRVQVARFTNGAANTMGYRHDYVDNINFFEGSKPSSTTMKCEMWWIDTMGMAVKGAKQMYFGQRN